MKQLNIAIVVYKDGSYFICEDGISFEYENDPDFLTIIRI